MIKYLILLTMLFCSFVFAQTYEWVNLVSPDYPYNPTYLHSTVAIDNSGNPVCARLIHFRQTYGSGIYGDVKLEKRSSSGSLLWENTIYGTADVSELIVNTDDNVICIGTYRDTITIETSQLIYSGSGTGNFILKLNDNGNLVWLYDGSPYITGYGELTALLQDGQNNILLGMSDYPTESKIIKLDPDGNIISTIQQTSVETISDIDVDTFGNIWITGFVFGNQQVSFNGLDTIAPFIYNDYVVKYNSSGTPLWVSFVEDVTVQGYNIETDDSGNCYLSGNLFISTYFGNLLANGPQWVYDFVVTKISPNGDYLWLNEIPPGNPLGDAAIGNSNFFSCGSNGDAYLTGFFRGTINFGGGVTLTPIHGYDVFVLSYNKDGVIQWAKAAGGDSYNLGCGVVTDYNGSCYVSGVVSQNAVFDTISVMGGELNLFLAKLKYGNVVSVDNSSVDGSSMANDFMLMQNYPNPFNPITKIKFTIPSVIASKTKQSQLVRLKVYDVLGNEIATLVNEEKQAGNYEVRFDASNLSSGVYLYRLQANDFTELKKMILLR